MLATDQVVGRVAQIARLDHQLQHVGLAVTDADMARLGQPLGTLGNALIALDPAAALAQAASVAISVLELARPAPGVEHAQRLALGTHHVGGVQVQPALGLVAQRPQAFDLLTVVVQLCRVLKAQHHPVLCHACLAGLPVGREHLVPADLFVAQEAVSCRCFGPALARPRNAGRGLLRQPLGQQHGTPVQPLIAQLNALEFFLAPAHQGLPCLFGFSGHTASVYLLGLVCNGMPLKLL